MNKKTTQNNINKHKIYDGFLDKKRNLYLCFIILSIITVFVYANILGNELLNFDDNEYFIDPEITQLSWHNLKLYFSHYYLIMYQPLPVLTFAIHYYFSQTDVLPLHLFNLICHLLNVWLVYLFVFKLKSVAEIKERGYLNLNNQQCLSSNRLSALIVATLFAIHPMNVEAVTWISARSSSLYTFFYLLSLIFYVNHINLEQKKYLFFLGIAFVLSLFSKAQAVTLPVILLVIDYYCSRINRSTLQKMLFEKAPFFILSGLFSIVTILNKDTMNNITNGMLTAYTYPEIFCLVCYSFLFYIYKIFVPINLCAIHVYPPKINGSLPLIYSVSPLILFALMGCLWPIARHKKYVLFGLLIFFLSISINIQIIPSRLFVVSDRYGYFPYIGIFYIVGELYGEIAEKKIKINEYLKWLLWGLLLFYVFIFAKLTIQRNVNWENNISFMTDIIKKNPVVPYLSRAYGTRANALESNNQLNDALADYNKAIEINSTEAITYLNRSLLYMKMNRYGDAINDLNIAIKLQPNVAIIYIKRGLAKYASHDNEGALRDVNQAIKLNQSIAEAYNLRAILRFSLNDFKGSEEDFDKAIELNPSAAEFYKNRGIMFLKVQNREAACKDFTMASHRGNISGVQMQGCNI